MKNRMTAQEVRTLCRDTLAGWGDSPLTCKELADLAGVPYKGTETQMGHNHLVVAFVEELIASNQARWLTAQRRNRAFTTNMKGQPFNVRQVASVDTGRIERDVVDRLSMTVGETAPRITPAPHSGLLIEQIVIACTTLLTQHGQRAVSESEVRTRVLRGLGLTMPPVVERRVWLDEAWSNVWRTACSALGQYGFWWRDGNSMRLSTRMILTECSRYNSEEFSAKVQTDTRTARRKLDEIKQRTQAERGGLLTMVTRGGE